jgi:hypothetical protein
MSVDKRSVLSQIFIALMIFSALVGAWSVAFMISWQWEKNDHWKPEFRVVATCGDEKEKKACGFAYSELADAKANGKYLSLTPPEPAGDLEEERGWLKWKDSNGLIETKASSWYFQTTIHYKLESDVPVLVEYQDVDVARAFYYGVAAALFSLLGIYLRKLRG